MKTVRLKIDNQHIEAPEGQTIFQAARANGIDIPHLCFDPRLDPFTSCWLCTVEVKGFPRLVPSCTAKVAEGMEVFTRSERVVSARKTCLDLLLSDHYGDCIAPCQQACPDHIDIQGYLALIALGRYREALELIREVNPLPLCVGRVCPRFCEKECRRNLVDEPVGINFLKRFSSEHGYEGIDPSSSVGPDTGFRVAIIGAGPAGLAAAHFLRLQGHQATIFEANPKPGGMLRYGIPEYRLPKREMDRELDLILGMGVGIEYGVRLGRDMDIQALREKGFNAILLAIGAWAERKLGCEGECLAGVESGIGFLYRIASGEKVRVGKKVSVIGGGNTAIDAARSCLRLGAQEVHLIYRRSREEMPANEEEIKEAEHEGVQIHFLSAPVQVTGSGGKVCSACCIQMELGEPDASGRRRPVPVEGSEYAFETDMVIAAIGQFMGDQDTLKDMGIELTRRGTVAIDEKTAETSLPGVFAAGDCVLGPATVIEAIAGGRHAAAAIDGYLRKASATAEERGPYNHSKGDLDTIDTAPFEAYEKIPRAEMPSLPVQKRLKGFEEVERGLTEEMAIQEAGRCLSCGCEAVFDCKLREYASEYGLAHPEVMKGRYNRYQAREEHPLIVRDRNKCIRCGLCVRMCAEVEGASAYGFVNRGFQTIIDPPLDLPLQESSCDSCGLCLSTCPTGALEYRPRLPKPGPWLPRQTETICTLCGMGCEIVVKTRAGHCLEVSPRPDGGINQGRLCWRGTFGGEMVHSPLRQRGPFRLQDGRETRLGWDEAIAAAGKSLKEKASTQALAIIASPRLALEDSILIRHLAAGCAIGELYMPGVRGKRSGLLSHGRGADYRMVQESDFILCLGSRIVQDFPLASYMIKDAVRHGAGLAIIGTESSRLTDRASVWLEADCDMLGTLLSLLSACGVENGLIQAVPTKGGRKIPSLGAKDRDILDQSVRKGMPTELLRNLLNARQPVVVVNASMVSDAQLSWLFEGIWGNLRFLPLSLFAGDGRGAEPAPLERLEKCIKDGIITGLLAFGHWKGLERIKQAFPGLMVVQSAVFRGRNGYQPDIFLPASLPFESSGRFVNAEGRMQKLTPVGSPPSGMENGALIIRLAEAMGVPLPYARIEDAAQELSESPVISCREVPDECISLETGGTTRTPSGWETDEIEDFLQAEIGACIFRKGEMKGV
ncbi:MAG: FAD-dependent oxidoreductase [bacterium]